MNRVLLAGRVEERLLRALPNGVALGRLVLRVRGQELPVVAWREQVQAIEGLERGAWVLVEGEIRSGQRTEVTALRVTRLGAEAEVNRVLLAGELSYELTPGEKPWGTWSLRTRKVRKSGEVVTEEVRGVAYGAAALALGTGPAAVEGHLVMESGRPEVRASVVEVFFEAPVAEAVLDEEPAEVG